jgi:MinD superfamily P-loop ATPase
MIKVSVISGKGGAGKTTVAVNLALSSGCSCQFVDCDVEEPNGKIFLLPRVERLEYVPVPVPLIDRNLCNYCGKCAQFCVFNAIAVVKEKILLFEKLCRGCGGCFLICPEGAISEGKRNIGIIRYGEVEHIKFIEGELNPGEEMTQSIIYEMKNNMDKFRPAIIDSPPGLCPSLVEAINDTDYCIIVAEPTISGFHDMNLSVELLENLSIPFGIVINKEVKNISLIQDYCRMKGLEILLSIPYDREIACLYSRGIPFSMELPDWRNKFRDMFHNIIKKCGDRI